MATQRANKSARTAGIKALIAAGAVAATLAGWALLPANDPPAQAAGTDSPSAAPVVSAPSGGTRQGTTSGSTQLGRTRSFTRSHSSR